MKKLIMLIVVLSACTNVLTARHYIYLKNTLNSGQFGNAPVKSANVNNASMFRLSNNQPDSYTFMTSVPPSVNSLITTYANSSSDLNSGECPDEDNSPCWGFTADIVPSDSSQPGVVKGQMQPIKLAQTNDVLITYLPPTSPDPNVYYGYVTYYKGNGWGNSDNTNSGNPSAVMPILALDGKTKFPATKLPVPASSAPKASTSPTPTPPAPKPSGPPNCVCTVNGQANQPPPMNTIFANNDCTQPKMNMVGMVLPASYACQNAPA